MQQNENEIKKKKELFDLSLIFTEGDEDYKFGVIVKAKKDGQETKLMEFDGDSIGMCYHGLKVVLREVASLHFKHLHETGQLSDEDYAAIMAQAE